MGGIFNVLTSIINGTINVISNVAAQLVTAGVGVVGEALSLTGNVLNATGNIVGNLVSIKANATIRVITGAAAIAEGVVNAAGHIVGRIVNVNGALINVLINPVGNVFDSAGNQLGNIFEVKGNVFKAIANVINGIVGAVTQITGNILKIGINVFGLFVKVMTNLIGVLSKLSNDLVKIFAVVLNRFTTIVVDITNCFGKFFTDAFPNNTDFIVNIALKAAKTAYDNVVAADAKAIADAKVNIADQVNKFNTDMNNQVTLAVNKVNNLAADLTERLNKADVTDELRAKCGTELNNYLENFGGKDIPYLSQCIDLNVAGMADNAVATVNGTLDQTKAIAAAMQKCIDPVKTNKDTEVKVAARVCLTKVSCFLKYRFIIN